jgi:photosystem II stability/assembly factor-like uncharacterized protein
VKVEKRVKPHYRVTVALFVLFLLITLSSCAPDAGILSGGSGTWQPSGLQHHSIHALAVGPNNSQKLYAGDDQGHLFVSTNAGQQWTASGTGLPTSASINLLSFDNPGKKLYAATAQGLFGSADAGQHWTLVGSQGAAASHLPVDTYRALAFVSNEPGTIYAGTQHQGVFVTTDGGNTWKADSNGLPQGAAIYGLSFDETVHQLWAATAVGIYRSDDRGASWRAFNTGLPAGLVTYSVQSASASGGTQNLIYAGTSKGFFRSRDDGTHWEQSQESLSGAKVYWILVDFHTSNSTVLYAATDLGAFRSDDAGQNWRAIAPGLPKNTAVNTLALGADNNAQLFAATDGVYQYPGTSNSFSSTRIVPLILIFFFFYLLFRFTQRTRFGRRNTASGGRVGQSQLPGQSPTTPPER